MLNKLILSTLLTITALSFSYSAQADIEIEPYIGYYGAKTKKSITVTSPSTKTTDTDNTYASLAYGGKLGWSIVNLTLGGDFMMYTHGTEKATLIGPAVSLDLLLLTLKASYFLSSTIKDGAKTATGTGLKAGLGFSVFPFVQLNVEYMALTLNKMKDTDLGDFITNYDEKVSGVFASVSLVF